LVVIGDGYFHSTIWSHRTRHVWLAVIGIRYGRRFHVLGCRHEQRQPIEQDCRDRGV
jgi:hypothetical protein